MEWQWHQMDHMQIICTSPQTYNHASTSPLKFLQAGCPSCRPTNNIKATSGCNDWAYSYKHPDSCEGNKAERSWPAAPAGPTHRCVHTCSWALCWRQSCVPECWTWQIRSVDRPMPAGGPCRYPLVAGWSVGQRAGEACQCGLSTEVSPAHQSCTKFIKR